MIKRTGLKRLTLNADRRALKQVLLNLLSNAVKFTPQGGTIRVRLTRDSGKARISITDTGIGISQTKLGKLGRPFEQVQNHLTKNHKGSGLGLAISRSLVENAWRGVRDQEQGGPRHDGYLSAAHEPRTFGFRTGTQGCLKPPAKASQLGTPVLARPFPPTATRPLL